ncbi:hypothetical protein UGMREWDR_CDS0255 [Aeromonas phage GomatiRiver_11]|nr:hypothetical protein OBDJBBDK_00250 [Aeromonas phage AhFM11]WKW84414.1 hypothetical protein UGMREWDR_CDS0255 [Aeromonas phage GomatiRiver_11]
MFNTELKNKLHDFIYSGTIDIELRGMDAYRNCMSIFSLKESPLYSPTKITKVKRWQARNLEYSAVSRPLKFDGPVWDSCFPMMFATTLRERFGHIMINDYKLEDIIDTLKEMRKEYKKQQALYHLEWLKNNIAAASKLGADACSAQYTCKAILNCLYGYLITRSDFNNISFEMEVQKKFDAAAKTIIENGGVILHASVDSFVYKSELPITFDYNQHNDKFSNVIVFKNGYATDIGKSFRLGKANEKAVERFTSEQRMRFLK